MIAFRTCNNNTEIPLPHEHHHHVLEIKILVLYHHKHHISFFYSQKINVKVERALTEALSLEEAMDVPWLHTTSALS